MEKIIVIFGIIFVFLIICGIMYSYAKLLAYIGLRKARNAVDSGKMTDENLLKQYRKYKEDDIANDYIMFGPFVYFVLKKVNPIILGIYENEIKKRGLFI